ncbi:MAG TPA: substrate-binding domain-containing protein [Chryseosolibacter sp.]
MQTRKPSINDLARKLNISKTTVSFILNGKAKEKRISDALVLKVNREAAKLGYQPNQFAKSLRTGKTNIIGLMVEDISNPFYASIAKIIEDKVYQNGYKIIYCSTENDTNRAREFLKMFSTLGVDGCIIAPTLGMESDINDMIARGKNIVLFDKTFSSKLADTVIINNRQSMYKAVEHLIKRGFRKIALVAMALDKPEKEERILGYREAMADHKLIQHVHALPFKVHYPDYVTDIEKFLKKNKNLDAIVFGTNYLGVAGLEAINNIKLSIPTDLAVLSFDDHDLFRIHKPTISVIAQPIDQIAQTVIDTLLSKLQDKKIRKRSGKVFTLPGNLIVRDSTEKQ